MEHTEFLWAEKYRPKTLAECILPLALKKQFSAFVETGNLMNMLLYGSHGLGKTTVAKAICEELGADVKFINGSLDRNIDTLRYDVVNFASTVSMTGGRKVVIFDEADNMNPTSSQPALRGMIEEFADNCSFIFTCNDISRIIPPIRLSRLVEFDFSVPSKEAQSLAAQMFKRTQMILEAENIPFKKEVLAELITKNFPDYRRTLMQLQRYAVTFKNIDTGILANVKNEAFGELLKFMRAKNWTSIRRWVGEHSELIYGNVWRELYDLISPHCDAENCAGLITLLNEYQYKAAFVVDAEINVTACLTIIMTEVVFK